MNKLIFLTYNGFFTQHTSSHKNINMRVLEKKFKELGYEVSYLEYEVLAKMTYSVCDKSIYITGSHQNISSKAYINKVLSQRFLLRNNLVPNLQSVLCHEDKGSMGICASEKKLDMINQDFLNSCISDLKYPFVFKKINGAGSTGVKLIRSKKDYIREYNLSLILSTSINSLVEFLKNRIRCLKGERIRAEYFSSKYSYVKQDFVSNLKNDFKVLVFWDKVYVLKRNVRDNDFRASGSGNFEIIDENVDVNLIDTAILIRSKLDVPYCSLDLVYVNGRYQLIEFQTCHFGPYTLLSSKGYYQNKKFNYDDSNYEDAIFYALYNYLLTK